MNWIIEHWLITLIILIVILAILGGIEENIPNRLKSCLSCNDKTRVRNEKDQPVCSNCQEKIKLEQATKKEGIRNCPIDGHPMAKKIIKNTSIIIDTCPTCKGTWIDENKMKLINQTANHDEDDNGTIAAIGLGIIVFNS